MRWENGLDACQLCWPHDAADQLLVLVLGVFASLITFWGFLKLEMNI